MSSPEIISKLSIGEILNICIQICEGVKYLQSKGIYHRNIKPQNILIMDKTTALLSDYDLEIINLLKKARNPCNWNDTYDFENISKIIREILIKKQVKHSINMQIDFERSRNKENI